MLSRVGSLLAPPSDTRDAVYRMCDPLGLANGKRTCAAVPARPRSTAPSVRTAR